MQKVFEGMLETKAQKLEIVEFGRVLGIVERERGFIYGYGRGIGEGERRVSTYY